MEYIIFILILFGLLLLTYKLNKLTDVNGNFIPDELEDLAEDVKEDLLSRAKNVKEELEDVKSATKNLVKQSGDVFEAAAGAKRKGRKKNGSK
tara:strand:+ start:155 stop:433 length:279 start_codon:yes stop_codon:yes gene_type:complete